MGNILSDSRDQKIDAFKKIHADLSDIVTLKKCRTCACFYKDVLNIVYEKIRSFREIESDNSLAGIEDDFARWVKGATLQQTHG